MTFKHRIRCITFRSVVSIGAESGKSEGETRVGVGRHTIGGDDEDSMEGRQRTHRGMLEERRSWVETSAEGTHLGTLACKFFLLVVRHLDGALLICFCSKKVDRWTLCPEEAVRAFLVPFCARQDDGGEEVQPQKVAAVTRPIIYVL